jgi:predicted aspartyl protease
MIFPYVRHFVDRSSAIPSGEIARPEIQVRIIGPAGTVEASGLIDTGADHVFLPVLLAEILGIEIQSERQEAAAGAGGHDLKIWPAEVELEITRNDESYRWLVQAGFVESSDDFAPAYLGHAGILGIFSSHVRWRCSDHRIDS